MLSLSEVQDRHHGRFLVLGRVALEDFFNELVVLLRELERDVRIVLRGVSVLDKELLELGGA